MNRCGAPIETATFKGYCRGVVAEPDKRCYLHGGPKKISSKKLLEHLESIQRSWAHPAAYEVLTGLIKELKGTDRL